MKIAICPGSFDPITLGHKDIIERASQLFETLFLPAKGENMFLSSSMVKEVCSLGGDISSFVPQEILNDIYKRCKGDGKND